MQGFPVVLAPCGDFVGIGWLGIDAHDYFGEEGLAKTVRRICLADTLRRSVDRIKMHCRIHSRYLRPVLDMPGDGFFAQFGEVVSSPIPLQPGNVEAVK